METCLTYRVLDHFQTHVQELFRLSGKPFGSDRLCRLHIAKWVGSKVGIENVRYLFDKSLRFDGGK